MSVRSDKTKGYFPFLNMDKPSKIRLLPKVKEFKKYSIPSKWSLIGGLLSALGLLVAVISICANHDFLNRQSIQETYVTQVRGKIIDENGNGVPNALIYIVGNEGDSVRTSMNGQFVLKALADDGQPILLHVEKEGYGFIEQLELASDFPVTILFENVRKVKS